MTHEREWSPGDTFYRVKLKAHRTRGKKSTPGACWECDTPTGGEHGPGCTREPGKVRGYYVYLPRESVREAMGEAEPPEVLYAARLVLQRGARQVLVRLYREPE